MKKIQERHAAVWLDRKNRLERFWAEIGRSQKINRKNNRKITKTSMKTLKASSEFTEGKNGIGYVSSNFVRLFWNQEFQESAGTPKFQKLPREMNDIEIESELNPGICSLGDVLAFLKNPPEESKDGYFNLFYFPDCFFYVGWYSVGRGWGVRAWLRDDDGWSGGERVFSPATDLEKQTKK